MHFLLFEASGTTEDKSILENFSGSFAEYCKVHKCPDDGEFIDKIDGRRFGSSIIPAACYEGMKKAQSPTDDFFDL